MLTKHSASGWCRNSPNPRPCCSKTGDSWRSGWPTPAARSTAGRCNTMTAPDKQRAAAALAYRTGDAAPRVVAKGRGILADTIIEKARASGVYVHESRELLALLMQIDLDSHIPPQLYIAVAELLAWLYHMEESDKQALPHNNT